MAHDKLGLVGILFGVFSLIGMFGYMIYRLYTYSGTEERAKVEAICHKSWRFDLENQAHRSPNRPRPSNVHQNVQIRQPQPNRGNRRQDFGMGRGFQVPTDEPAQSLTELSSKSDAKLHQYQIEKVASQNFSRGPFTSRNERIAVSAPPPPPPKDIAEATHRTQREFDP